MRTTATFWFGPRGPGRMLVADAAEGAGDADMVADAAAAAAATLTAPSAIAAILVGSPTEVVEFPKCTMLRIASIVEAADMDGKWFWFIELLLEFVDVSLSLFCAFILLRYYFMCTLIIYWVAPRSL